MIKRIVKNNLYQILLILTFIFIILFIGQTWFSNIVIMICTLCILGILALWDNSKHHKHNCTCDEHKKEKTDI